MDSKHHISPYDAVLKNRISQICDHLGYSAISVDSSNILVDIYRRTLHLIGKHCQESASYNRRTDATYLDLIRAFDIVGISIPELQEHIESVKLPAHVEVAREDDDRPSNRIQRKLHVDDLLEAEKDTQQGDDENGSLKNGDNSDEYEKPAIPLLKECYHEIASRFQDVQPVVADKKVRLGGRIVIVAPGLRKDSVDQDHKSESSPKLSVKAKLKIPKVETQERADKPKTHSKGKIASKIKKEKASKKTKGKRKSRVERHSKKAEPKILPVLPDVLDVPQPAIEEQDEIIHDIKKEVEDVEPCKVESRVDKKPRGSKKITPEKQKHKKQKTTHVKPLDPDIAEPPSFLPILESIKNEKQEQPYKPASSKLPKAGKNKKKGSKFEIITETVTATDEKEWLCPACGAAEDGTPANAMMGCDVCEEWYHLSCLGVNEAPEGDWVCDLCRNASTKTPVESPEQAEPIEPVKPVVLKIGLASPPPEPPAVAGSSQDELCPHCNRPDNGTLMIQCEDPFCARWFHGECVNLTQAPEGSWFCRSCVEKQQSAFGRRRRAK